MATFITLGSFTDQGIRNIKASPERYEAFVEMARGLGVTVRDMYYAVGEYDFLLVLEGPEEAVTTALLGVGSLGNVRTQTLRGFSLNEMKKIIGDVP